MSSKQKRKEKYFGPEQAKELSEETAERVGETAVKGVVETTDELLDLIDEVLAESGIVDEQSAQKFVEGYVNQGGE